MNLDAAAAAAALMLEVGNLQGLQAWEPVGSALEELPNLLRGRGQLTAEQVQRLRRWARRWRALGGPLRAFYEAEVNDCDGSPHGLVASALWRVLEGDSATFSQKQEMLLKIRWRDRYGSFPSYDLCPRLPSVR